MSSRLSMNTTFRPRPIDINRPLEIHRGILPSDADGCVRGVPSLPTGMEPEEEEEAHIQEAIAASLAFNASSLLADIEIPTPLIKVVEGYDTAPNPNPYTPGNTYIFYRGEDLDNIVEYDLDSEDEEFLETINQQKKVLTDEKFEFAMDKFEKEVHYHHNADVPLQRAEALLKTPTSPMKREVIVPLLEHWKNKKQSRDGGSLLTRYYKPPSVDDPSPYVAFRPREKDKDKNKKVRKNDTASLNKMRALRQEMERSRTLLEMLKKREKLKKDQFMLVAQVFEQLLIELALKRESEPLDESKPVKKKHKSSLHTTPPPSTPNLLSPIPSISSPTDNIPKAKTPSAPRPSKPEYFYDIALVNTRLKIDPATAAIPYFLNKQSSSSSLSSSSRTPSTTPPSMPYNSFLQALDRRAPRSVWPLEDEGALSDFEDNDALLYESEEEESEIEDEGPPDISSSLSQLDDTAFFPRTISGHIVMSREATPFRGRARLGRGGRILFDRPIRIPRPTPPITTTAASITSPSPIPPTISSPIDHLHKSNTISNNNNEDTSSISHSDSNINFSTPTSASPTKLSNYNEDSMDTNYNDSYQEKEDEKEITNDENEYYDAKDAPIGNGNESIDAAMPENDDGNDSDVIDGNPKRSGSPINSEPEARLQFNHRLLSTLPTTPPIPAKAFPPIKAFSPTIKVAHSQDFSSTTATSTTTSTRILDTSPSSSPPPSPSSCLPVNMVLHTYSKKQKRKLVDTSIPPVAM